MTTRKLENKKTEGHSAAKPQPQKGICVGVWA